MLFFESSTLPTAETGYDDTEPRSRLLQRVLSRPSRCVSASYIQPVQGCLWMLSLLRHSPSSTSHEEVPLSHAFICMRHYPFQIIEITITGLLAHFFFIPQQCTNCEGFRSCRHMRDHDSAFWWKMWYIPRDMNAHETALKQRNLFDVKHLWFSIWLQSQCKEGNIK